MKNISRLVILTALFTAALFTLVFSGRFSEAKVTGAETANNGQTLPNLSGEEAKDHLKEQGLYESLGEAMKVARYSINPTKNAPLPNTKEAFAANNPHQAFSTYFAEDGIHLVSETENNKWRVQMNLTGYGYGDKVVNVVKTKTEVQKNKSRIEISKSAKDESKIQNPKPKIVEWYENTASGLEQGWTLNEKPFDENNSELNLKLKLGGDLQAKMKADGQAILFNNKKGEEVLRYDKLKSWDADGRELASRMELDNQTLSILVDDKDAKYPITVDPVFTQTRKIVANDAAARDEFGTSVSISGDMAIVGAPLDDAVKDNGGNQGSAYIFERNTGGANMWGQVKKLVADDAIRFQNFGFSVAISGDTAIIGADRDNAGGSNKGSAYIFGRNTGGANMWGQVRKLVADDGVANDNFGSSVAISGDTAIAGAAGHDAGGNNRGAAYIFERNTGGANMWGQSKKLVANDGADFDGFGSVSISGDTAIVGAFNGDSATTNSGAAYIFGRNAGGANMWGQVLKLVANDAATADQFGWSVAISGDTAIVGAFRDDDAGTDSGSGYIFGRNTGGANMWGQVQKLVANDAAARDLFGRSVAIAGETAIVGSIGNVNGGIQSGSAYIFERNTGGANIWGQVQKLVANDAALGDFFGGSVAISGDTAIVGASQDSDAGVASGSSYVFTGMPTAAPVVAPFDFDGDGKTDLSVFRPMADANLFDFAIRQSSNSSLAGYSWGLPGDKLAPGDYDGDGRTDVAVYRAGSPSTFYILHSSGGQVVIDNFGFTGDVLTVGDWDGDGKDDVSVYRAGTLSVFYFRGSSNNPNGNITFVPWGTTGDQPMRGDFDGDGIQDAAVFRPSNATWYIRNSSNGSVRYASWGIATDKFVPADYDGDGKTDLAVFRPSNATWYILQSSNNQMRYIQFGLSNDILVPADYDGDGKVDEAVFRNGIWYLNQSTSGFSAQSYGQSGDTPIPNAYVNP